MCNCLDYSELTMQCIAMQFTALFLLLHIIPIAAFGYGGIRLRPHNTYSLLLTTPNPKNFRNWHLPL